MKRNQKGLSPIVTIVIVASDLDNTDMNQFDKELNQLDADASTF